MTHDARSFRYRFDLDGVRGIAIALVVLYHVFIGRVSGGVDVFLLLSGYFFLGSQLRYADKPNASFNPWWPLWRTARRLVPSLVLSVSTTYLLVRLVTPQLLSTELTQQLTATMFYYQNIELARQDADYAAASAMTSPLQHLWSMAVQGQFYALAIAFSLGLGWALRRSRYRVQTVAGPLLIIATIASFAYAARYGLHAPAKNYYDTWARLWELTLGGTLALYSPRWQSRLQSHSQSRRQSHWQSHFANFCTGLGLCAIGSTGLIIADSTAYPGPLALLPLGGVALIIVAGESSLSRLLAKPPTRWLGNIAYPLYLWHWPLLIISTAALDKRTPPWWLGIIIIAISLLLASATTYWVEKPLQQAHRRPTADDLPLNRARAALRTLPGKARAAGAVVVAAGFIGILLVQPLWLHSVALGAKDTQDFARYPGAMAFQGAQTPNGVTVKPDPILVGGIVTPVTTNWCFVPKQADPDYFPTHRHTGGPCIFGDPHADFSVYLVGGSHAEQWSGVLDKLGKEMGFRLIPLLRQDCPIELGAEVTVSPACAEWAQLAVDKLVDAHPNLVFSTTTRPVGENGHGPDGVPPGYLTFWEKLAAQKIPFLGLRDNPWGFDKHGNPQEFDECYVTTQDALGCGMSTEEVYAPTDPAAAVLARFKNMLAVDTSTWFCQAGICPVVIGNVFVYRDMHHISKAFADSAAPLLREYLRPFLAGKEQQQQSPIAQTEDAEYRSDEAPPVASSSAVPVPYPAPVTAAPV